jgi:hypothetical protein
VKKLFALMAIASLAAIGCDDKKTSPPKGGGTVTQTRTNTVVGTDTYTRTVVETSATKTLSVPVVTTTTIKDSKKPDGPVVPDPKKGDGK